MKVKYLKLAAGVEAGTEKDLPIGLANQLIAMGIAEEVKSAPKKEAKPEMETKEEKTVSKRRTKAKK
jgi:hypothetical protein